MQVEATAAAAVVDGVDDEFVAGHDEVVEWITPVRPAVSARALTSCRNRVTSAAVKTATAPRCDPLAGLTEALSAAITAGLQAGAPVSEFVTELRQTRYTPARRTGDPDVPEGTSLGDHLARRLHHHPLTCAHSQYTSCRTWSSASNAGPSTLVA